MWAQLVQARLKPGREADLADLVKQLQAMEQTGSGLVRSTAIEYELADRFGELAALPVGSE